MNIYVASSWRNEHQPSVVTALRKVGHQVYDFRNPQPGDNGFHWSEIDSAWESWTPARFRSALSSRIADRGFANDFQGMNDAQACVLVLPCGRSAHLEAGWFCGAGRPVFIYIPEAMEPELMYRLAGSPFDAIHTTIDSLIHETLFGTFAQKEGLYV